MRDMSTKSFEDYLMAIFKKEGMVTDEDFKYLFGNWLYELSVNEWLKHGEDYAELKVKEALIGTIKREG